MPTNISRYSPSITGRGNRKGLFDRAYLWKLTEQKQIYRLVAGYAGARRGPIEAPFEVNSRRLTRLEVGNDHAVAPDQFQAQEPVNSISRDRHLNAK